jgi:predicted ATP-grasp superfamily ATP-dependent carboligase
VVHLNKTLIKQTQPIAVVVGTCGHGLSVIRALTAGGVSIIALEANPQLPGAKTRLATVEMIPDINSARLIESLLELRTQIDCPGIPVLFLTNDRMIRVIGEGWDRLQGLYNLSWSHSRQTLLPLLEKASLEPLCDLQGLAYPKTFVLDSAADVDRAIATIGFPIFVKPARPLSKFKTAQPKTPEELESLANTYPGDLPFLIQQFIPGDDTSIYFTALYLDHGRILARFDGHKLRSRPLGHTTVAEACIDNEVFKQTCDFFTGLNLSGPVSLELKRDQLGGLWVIEPTVGRTDFWIDLCTANGVNLPLIEYLHQTSKSVSIPVQKNTAVWFNEERDPFGRLWLFGQKNLHLGTRKATYLFLHRSDVSPAVCALKAIIATLATSVVNRVKRLQFGSNKASSSSVQSFSINEELPLDVQNLFTKAEFQDVEFGLTWYKNLIKTVYSDEQGIHIYTLQKNGTSIAAIPVHIIEKSFGKKIESVSNYYTTLYAPVITPDLSPSCLSILIRAIVKTHASAGTMRLAPMDRQSETYRILVESCQLAGLIPKQFFCFGNWFQPIDESWESYLNHRESKLKNTIKRKTKKLSMARGSMELITGGSDLSRGLDAYQHVYASSWKKPEPYPNFIPGLITACANKGWLRLGILWLDGKAIAAQFWIVANGKASIYKLAYDEHFKEYAPGTLLTAMLMEHVIENDKVTEVDYLAGDDPYKKAWMSQRRERWGIIAYNPKTFVGFFGLCKEVTGRWLKPVSAKLNRLHMMRFVSKLPER